MSWTALSTDRWTFDGDDQRHLLLKSGTRYVELHDISVHVYEGPAAVADTGWPLGSPEATNPPMRHVLSDVRHALAGLDDDGAWQALAGAEYTRGGS